MSCWSNNLGLGNTEATCAAWHTCYGKECESVCVTLPDSPHWWYSWCHYWLRSDRGVLFRGLAMCWCHVANLWVVSVCAFLLPSYLCGGLLPSSLGFVWGPIVCVAWLLNHFRALFKCNTHAHTSSHAYMNQVFSYTVMHWLNMRYTS